MTLRVPAGRFPRTGSLGRPQQRRSLRCGDRAERRPGGIAPRRSGGDDLAHFGDLRLLWRQHAAGSSGAGRFHAHFLAGCRSAVLRGAGLKLVELRQVVEALRLHTITQLDAAEAAEARGAEGAFDQLALPSITEAKLSRLASQIGLDFDVVLTEFKSHVPILLASIGEDPGGVAEAIG